MEKIFFSCGFVSVVAIFAFWDEKSLKKKKPYLFFFSLYYRVIVACGIELTEQPEIESERRSGGSSVSES